MFDGICYGKGIEIIGSWIVVNNFFIEIYYCEGWDFFFYVLFWFYVRKDFINVVLICEFVKGCFVFEE